MPLKVYTKKRKDETVERQLDRQKAGIIKLRERDAAARKKRETTRYMKLKKKIKRILKGRHSPAGKRYLRSKSK